MAGFSSEQYLCEESILPGHATSNIAVATDDVTHFLRASKQEVDDMTSPPLAALDAAWDTIGIQSQTSKAKDLCLSATMLGMELVGGTELRPKSSRLVRLIRAVTDLLREPVATPREVSALVGLLQ